jgi:hypothetical protein
MDINQPGHPYNVIEGVRSSTSGSGVPINVTKEFKRYNLPSASLGGKEIPQEVMYYPDRDIFTVKTLTGDMGEITPEALESQLVEASGEYKARRVQAKKSSSIPGQSGDPLGIFQGK